MAVLITPEGLHIEIAPEQNKVSMIQIRDAVGAYHVDLKYVDDLVFCYDLHYQERNLSYNEKASEISQTELFGNVVILDKNEIDTTEI